MRFILSVASRFLFASKLQTFMIMVGIGVGVSVQIFIGSLIDGLQEDLIDSTVGSQPHITISSVSRSELLPFLEDEFESMKRFDDSINVVSPVLEGPANVDNSENDPVILRGFQFDDANKIYNFTNRLDSGELPNGDFEMMIGKDLANILDVSVGDEIELLIPSVGFEPQAFVVSGIFDLGVTSLNESWTVTSLNTLQNVFDTSSISKYELQINDVFESKNIQESLSTAYPDYNVSEWQSENEDLISGLEGQSISSLMIQIFVMISVVLGISSVLAITVLQKSKQIGILKAMGITNQKASLIFLAQGIILGFFGALIGITLGISLVYVFSTFARDAAGDPIVSVLINPSFIILSGFIAVVASTIASIIPARRSAKLNVIEVIRNG